jgi:general secretion pathway protein D
MRGANAVLIAVIGGAFAVGPWLVPGFGFMSPRIALAQEAGLGGPDLQETLDPAEIGQGVPLPPGVVPGAAEAIAHEEEDAEDAADVENEAVEDEEEAKVVEAPRPAPPVRVPITPRLDRAFGGNQKAGPARGRIFVENDLVNMDFADADIQDVVKQISEITGKNFILDERVRGKITIISPSKITIEEAYRVFESVLQVKGFTTIPVGDFIKIVPLREAKESYIETYPGGTRIPQRDQVVTRLIPLEYVDAADIASTLKPLASRDASMIAYGPTNTIIFSDTAYNINKVLDIIRQIDVSSYQEVIEIIQLRYASASELAGELREVFSARTARTTTTAAARRGRARRTATTTTATSTDEPRIITDERTNSLIILASPRQIEDVKDLIRRLDYETERGRIHVYYLENADAQELAETLGRLGVGEGQRGARPAAGPRPGQPGGVPAAVAATVAQLADDVKITHDEPTNALIIEASAEAYETLKEVIEKLDIKRPQVLVEALILEVSVGPNTLSTGVSLAGGSFIDPSDPRKGGIFGNTSASTFPTGGTGLISSGDLAGILSGAGAAGADPLFGSLVGGFRAVNVRMPGPDATMGTADDVVTPVPVIRAAIQAAAARTDTNILSAPNILTTDNQKAFITVGQNIPIQTSAVTTTSSATGVVTDDTLVNNAFERQDVGVTLEVTPQISEGDNVRLEIRNEITEVLGEDSPIGLPTLTNREIENTVFVADGATVVIGGIISSNFSKSSNRVPWLGDVPGLGWAFKNKSRSLRKTNLIIFLTPHIVRSPDDLRKVTNFKQRDFEKKSREALRKTEEEERKDREIEEKAAQEGKTVEEYEEKYDLDRARSPIDQALKEIGRKNIKEGEAPQEEAPQVTPGRKEEVIGAPEAAAKPAAGADVTARLIDEGARPEPAAEEAPAAETAQVAAVRPEAREAVAPPPGIFTVQVAAFTDRGQAQRLVDRLEKERYDVYITSAVTPDSSVVHRVRVGRFDTDADATRIANKIGKDFELEGTPPFVVKIPD